MSLRSSPVSDCLDGHGRPFPGRVPLDVMMTYRSTIRAQALAAFKSQPPTRVYLDMEAALTAIPVKDPSRAAMRAALLRYAPMLESCLLQYYPQATAGILPKHGTDAHHQLVIILTEMIFGHNGVDRPIVEAFLGFYRRYATNKSSASTY